MSLEQKLSAGPEIFFPVDVLVTGNDWQGHVCLDFSSVCTLIHFVPATECEDISLMHVLMSVHNRLAGYMQDGLH
jgi:hypothetical protein